MILNNANSINFKGRIQKMDRSRAVELSLIALRAYDPQDYVMEIHELYKCITENIVYEDEPRLSRKDMINILERLTQDSRHSRKNSLRGLLEANDASRIEKDKIAKLISDIFS